MLQQTQVSRVSSYLPRWLERFPDVEALASSPVADVLELWQGMGYNRRALALQRAASVIATEFGGVFPRETAELVSLPGIGPATAQGIRSFAFDLPGVYLETNVRTVFLHHFFPDVPGVPDRELVPLIEGSCPSAPGAAGQGAFAPPQDADDTPRNWYYALLDYGAHLKKTVPNPSRRSAGHVRQSRFEGSRRQKRAEVVRLLLAARDRGERGVTVEDVVRGLSDLEMRSGRDAVERAVAEDLLSRLAKEGFCAESDGIWTIS